MPFLDLHRHLEGSHSPAALLDVAQRFAIHHPLFFDAAAQRFRSPTELVGDVTMAGPSDDANVFYGCIVKGARGVRQRACVRRVESA